MAALTYHVELPESMSLELETAADASRLSVHDFFKVAVAEKIARLEHSRWLAARRSQPDRQDTASADETREDQGS